MQRPPRLRVSSTNCVLNTAAAALLAQDGETHVIVRRERGRLTLQPIGDDERPILTVLTIFPRETCGGALLALASTLRRCGVDQKGVLPVRWNDAEGVLEVELPEDDIAVPA